MDLNLKYSEHQKALFKASKAPDPSLQARQPDRASQIAEEIEMFQLKLGAAASCAWCALKMASASQLTSSELEL